MDTIIISIRKGAALTLEKNSTLLVKIHVMVSASIQAFIRHHLKISLKWMLHLAKYSRLICNNIWNSKRDCVSEKEKKMHSNTWSNETLNLNLYGAEIRHQHLSVVNTHKGWIQPALFLDVMSHCPWKPMSGPPLHSLVTQLS